MRPGQLVPRDSLAGLRDKLYWRPSANGVWHCFKLLAKSDQRDGNKYISLCHRIEQARSGEGRHDAATLLAALREHFPHVVSNLAGHGVELVEVQRPAAPAEKRG